MTVDDEAEVLRAAWHSDGSVGTASASGILARFSAKGVKSEAGSLKCDDQVYGYIPLDAACGCGPDTAVVAWGSKIGLASSSGPEGSALDTVCDMKDLMSILEGEEGAPDDERDGAEADPMGIDETGGGSEGGGEEEGEEEVQDDAEGDAESFGMEELMNLLCIEDDGEEGEMEMGAEAGTGGSGPADGAEEADADDDGAGGGGAPEAASVDVFDVALASDAGSGMPGAMLALGLSTGGATVIYVSPATAGAGDDAEAGEAGWGLQPLWHHPSAHSGPVMSVCALLGLRGALEGAAGAAGSAAPASHGGAEAEGEGAIGEEADEDEGMGRGETDGDAGSEDDDAGALEGQEELGAEAEESDEEESDEEESEEEEGPAGPIIATGGSDGYVCLWDTQLPCTSPIARLSGISDAGFFALWAPREGEAAPAACGVDAGPWVLIAVSGSTVVAWDLRPVIGLAKAGRGSLSAFDDGPPAKLAPAAWAVLPGSTIHALAVSAEGVFVGGELVVDGAPATVAKVSLAAVQAASSPPAADWLD